MYDENNVLTFIGLRVAVVQAGGMAHGKATAAAGTHVRGLVGPAARRGRRSRGRRGRGGGRGPPRAAPPPTHPTSGPRRGTNLLAY